MRKLLLFLLGLLLFFTLGYWCLNKTTAPRVQDDINTRVTQSLHDANFDSVNAKVSGRDLTLSGIVSNEQQRKLAEQVANVDGVRIIDNQIAIDSQLITEANINQSRYFLTISKDKNNQITMKGYIPDSLAHHNLVSYAMKTLTTTDISDYLTVRPNPPNNWIAISKTGIDSLKPLNTGQLSLSDKNFELSGTSNKQVSIKSIRQNLISSLPTRYQGHVNVSLKQVTNRKSIISAAKSSPISKSTDCHNKLNKAVANVHIVFKTGNVTIAQASSKQLSKLAKIKANCPTQHLIINGYTDSIGDKQFNRILSEKRANAVKDYLISQGVLAKNIITKGYGEAFPIASNNTLAGQKKNRRIKIIVRDPKQ